MRRFVGHHVPDSTLNTDRHSDRKQGETQQLTSIGHIEKTIKRPGQSKTKDIVLRYGNRDDRIEW